MTIATLILALIATPAAGPGEPMLLDFHADWCGPCRQMRPAVDQLVRMGYPVKSVDIDKSADLKERYQVEQVPTFIVIDGTGKELARAIGAQPPRELATLYNGAVSKVSKRPTPEVERTSSADPDASPDAGTAEEPSEASESDLPRPVNPRPWETVVRIKMHVSNNALVFGSGTIISSTPDESIILTCAHIFKVDGPRQMSPSQYNRRISVDLFDGQLHGPNRQQLHPAQLDIPGEAIDYDFTHDVGLIRIRPGRRLPASRVIGPDWQPKRGLQMFTVGCSNGKDATAWSTQILEPRVTMSNSATTIKCANQPREGRSGGGLYTTDGYVAGVCDFADPNEHTGLYATPGAIHALLDRNRMMALYRPTTGQPDRLLASNPGRQAAGSGTKFRAQSPSEVEPRLSGSITLPPPALAGVKMPEVEPGGWNPPVATPSTRVASNSGRTRPGQRIIEDDPGVPSRTAIATEAEVEPTEEDRIFDDLARRPEPKAEAPIPARNSGKSSWTRSTRQMPDPAMMARP
ncbi:thioredoxin domain-containing protein [Tundrisphaera sp. TA3]|uniref:thioredoxin domain-containing protein n=1 Tax=Tundrisphaera sp. TA3 TaxID=3435775 RepID=UPI003EBB4D5E